MRIRVASPGDPQVGIPPQEAIVEIDYVGAYDDDRPFLLEALESAFEGIFDNIHTMAEVLPTPKEDDKPMVKPLGDRHQRVANAMHETLVGLLEVVATAKSTTAFSADYCTPANLIERKREGLGVAVSQWSKWDIQAILDVFIAALEDSNAPSLMLEGIKAVGGLGHSNTALSKPHTEWR